MTSSAGRRPDHPCRRLQLPQHAARHGAAARASPATTGPSRSGSTTPATSTTRTRPNVPIGPTYWSQNMQGSPVPDDWSAWRDDFFVPAARLMKTAPWLFVRGNHELCSRAGPGWFYLLDPARRCWAATASRSPARAQTPAGWRPGAWPKPPALPFQGEPFPIVLTPPHASEAGRARHHLASIRPMPAMPSSTMSTPTSSNTGASPRSWAIGRPTWLVTHRPIWGVVNKIQGWAGRRRALRLHQRHPAGRRWPAFPNGLPSNVTAVLSGHMHRFQAIGFGDRRPPQLIVGTAGIELRMSEPQPPHRTTSGRSWYRTSTASMPRWWA